MNAETISYSGVEYQKAGKRIGQTKDMCYMPRMTVQIVGYNQDAQWWLAQYIVPEGLCTEYTILTEDFLAYEDSQSNKP